MKKQFILLLFLVAFAAPQVSLAQDPDSSCFAHFMILGLNASDHYQFKDAIGFFKAAAVCRRNSAWQKVLTDSLVEHATRQLDSALAATILTGKVNEIASQAYNNFDVNPTLALRLAHEACRMSHNLSALAVRARRQLLGKKNTAFYRSNFDCGCAVNALDVSPESRYVAIGCNNSGIIKLYDRLTSEIYIIGSHDGKSSTSGPTMITRVVFDSFGERLLSASTDGTVKLWSLQGPDYELLDTYTPDADITPGADIGGIAFSPSGDSIIIASGYNVYLYRTRGKLLHTYRLPDEVHGLDFSPDGASIACGMKNFRARIIQLHNEDNFIELTGHTQAVSNVQFSHDGTLLLTSSHDFTAKLWEVRSGMELYTYEGHGAPILAIDFSSDDAYILTGSMDNTAKVWDRNGACRLTLFCSNVFYGATAFAPNDAFIVTADFEQHIRMWPLDFEAFNSNNLPHASNISALAVAPGNETFLTGSTDRTAKIWDLQSAQVLWTFQAEDDVAAADWCANGQRFILGLWNGTVNLFDRNRNLLGTFKRQHTSSITSIAMAPGGKRYITGGRDGIAKLWEIDDANQAQNISLLTHSKEVSTVAWSPDGKLVATGSRDGKVKVGLANLQSMKTLDLPGEVLDVRFSPNSRNLLVCCSGGFAKLFTVEGTELQNFEMDNRIDVTAGEFSSTGDTLLLGGRSGWVRVWIRAKKEWERSEYAHTGGISAIRRVGANRFLTAGTEGRARLYEYDFTSLRIYRGHIGDINHGAVTPGGRGFVTTSTDRSVKLWTLDNRAWHTLHVGGKITAIKPLLPNGRKMFVASVSRKAGLLSRFDADALNKELARFPGFITGMDCSADESLLAAGDDSGIVRVYDATGDTLRLLHERTLPVPAYTVAISPAGKYVVIGGGIGEESKDETAFVYLWEPARDTILAKLPHLANIRALAFPPGDNTYFVSGDDLGFIKFWRISDGMLLKTLSNEQKTTLTLSFSPNGKYLLSVDNESLARIWDATNNSGAVHHLMQYVLEDDQIVDAGFISNDSLVVFGKRLGGVILINSLELLDRQDSPIAPLSPTQREEFKIEYDTTICLSSTNPQEVLQCATSFAEHFKDSEDENDFQKAWRIYERLFELAPDDISALLAAHDLYNLKIAKLGQQNGPPDYPELVVWSAKLARIAQKLYLLEPDMVDHQDKLNTACWNYSWFLILTGDFGQAFEFAQTGLDMPSISPQQSGIVCNKLLAALMLADSEEKYQAVALEYRNLMPEKWIDDRYPTYREVFLDDFQSLLQAQPDLPQPQKDRISRIRKEVLEVR